MKCSGFSSVEKRSRADACVVLFAQDDEKQPLPLFSDKALFAACQNVLQAKDFTGAHGEVLMLYPDSDLENRVILVGIGPVSSLQCEKLRELFAKVAKMFIKKKVASLSCITPFFEHMPHELVLRALLEGVYFGSYTFTLYRSKKEESHLKKVSFLCTEPAIFMKVEKEVRARMAAVQLTRDLVNRNADDVTPSTFAEIAQSLDDGSLRVHVHGKEWIEKEKMGLVQAVSRGARTAPRFVILEWKGAPKNKDHTVLVGKGITFDSGGLDLKSAEGMKGMKGDMGGAAAVLGIMQGIRDLSLPINVSAAIPLCENSIDSESYKPEDVYFSRSGKSVEISNTDAEGRLILADALDYVCDRLEPSRVIDIATLTGASEVAMGRDITALFSNSDSLAGQLETAGAHAGETMWQMPLHLEYEKLLDSNIADCKILGSRKGGAIIAALFLHKFVGDIPWAHLDIAGTSDTKEAFKYFSIGATGVPVRALLEFFSIISSKKEKA